MNPTRNAMSWEELAIYAADPIDQINGLNNPYSTLRLFNKKLEKLFTINVTFS